MKPNTDLNLSAYKTQTFFFCGHRQSLSSQQEFETQLCCCWTVKSQWRCFAELHFVYTRIKKCGLHKQQGDSLLQKHWAKTGHCCTVTWASVSPPFSWCFCRILAVLWSLHVSSWCSSYIITVSLTWNQPSRNEVIFMTAAPSQVHSPVMVSQFECRLAQQQSDEKQKLWH